MRWGSGAFPNHVSRSPNFVDTRTFQPRGPLPLLPTRALVFSNSAAHHLPAVRRACEPLGIVVDAAGQSVDAVADRPEQVLARYDVVFAKARCAYEAIAAGAAVVLCDAAGVGPLVTSANVEAAGFTGASEASRAYVRDRYHQPTDAWDASWTMEGAAADVQLYAEVAARLRPQAAAVGGVDTS